jgi:hypothetical protein
MYLFVLKRLYLFFFVQLCRITALTGDFPQQLDEPQLDHYAQVRHTLQSIAASSAAHVFANQITLNSGIFYAPRRN